MRKRFTHLQAKGAKKFENGEIMESYAMQCEKAIESGKRAHLPKILQTKLDEQKHERQDKALATASSPPKAAETAVPTPPIIEGSASPSTITTVEKASVQAEKGKASGPKEKKKGEKKGELREEPPEIVARESDEESEAGFLSDEQLEGTTEQNAGTGPTVQFATAYTSVTPKGADARTPMQVE